MKINFCKATSAAITTWTWWCGDIIFVVASHMRDEYLPFFPYGHVPTSPFFYLLAIVIQSTSQSVSQLVNQSVSKLADRLIN